MTKIQEKARITSLKNNWSQASWDMQAAQYNLARWQHNMGASLTLVPRLIGYIILPDTMCRFTAILLVTSMRVL